METLFQDLRYGVRMLLKSPGFTAVAVLTIALGIGATTAIFSVVNAILLRPLPYKEPDRLVKLWEVHKSNGSRITVSIPNFLDWKNENQSLVEMAAFGWKELTLTGGDTPERTRGFRVHPNVFALLGAQPALGRTFLPEEGQPGKDRVVLVSHQLWQRRFRGDPGLLGKQLKLNGEEYTVVGIMKPAFQLPIGLWRELLALDDDLWVPLASDADPSQRGNHNFQAIARLKHGVTIEQAQAEMRTIADRLEQQHPDTNRDLSTMVIPLSDESVANIRPALLLLFGAVGFVLLIACANVANLLLARALSQSREMAVRTALGASRLRLVRQLLTQSLELALVGGSAGVLLAFWGTDLLLALAPSTIPRLHQAGVDSNVLCFAVVLSLLTGLIFGLAPSLQGSKPDLNESLKEGGRTLAGSLTRSRLRGLLVVAETALSLGLLTSAGLLIKSFWRIESIDPGYRSENVVAMNIEPTPSKYREPSERAAFFEQVLERVEALREVRSAAVVSYLPLRGSAGGDFSVQGRESTADLDAEFRAISADYFRTMGTPLLQGREFDRRDVGDASSVAIINQTMARRFFPTENPIGKRIKRGSPWMTIVGIVGDVKHRGLTDETVAEIFVPYLQPSSIDFFPRELVVRTASDPLRLVPTLRSEVWAVDKDQPISDIRLLSEVLSESLSQRRFNMLLLSIFGMAGLLLAAVGVYGVLSHAVTQRTHEIGIRMALGAQRSNIVRLVVNHGLKLVLVGLAAGLGSALVLTRLLSTLLYGVTPTDPFILITVSVLLFCVALVACYIPARRATKVDPMVALRWE